jgi:hypothetical protein
MISKRATSTRVTLALIALGAVLPACHKWVSLDMPTTQAINEEPAVALRVTLADGSRVILNAPRISGDSVIASEDTVAVSLNEVRGVEARQTDVLATVGLATGIGVVGFFGFAVAVCLLGACAGT